jgi:hypothetical protein
VIVNCVLSVATVGFIVRSSKIDLK